jgi:hypothetical protein
MSALQCPRCGNKVEELQAIDQVLSDKIKLSGNPETLPAQVCLNCFSQLSGAISNSVVHTREKAKEHKKLMLWKSRVNLIRRARQLMSDKAYSDAAVQYEKYIKVLELVFEVGSGKLTPEAFKDSARTQELTVVAGVYWDLLRIYDTSESYGDRMRHAGEKLSQFLKFTPVYPDIMRKAEAFSKMAKHPSIVKSFIKTAAETKGRCFIATAAFESPYAEEVIYLQNWRDKVLVHHFAGRLFIKFYYRLSPPLASVLDRSPTLKGAIRSVLRLFIDRALRQNDL